MTKTAEEASKGSAQWVLTCTFTTYFPIPSLMNVKGGWVNNWEFVKQQWTDYKSPQVSTSTSKKIQLATFWRYRHQRSSTQVWSICQISIKQPPTANADAQGSQQAMESTRRPVHSFVKRLHSPSRLLLRLCWSQPTRLKIIFGQLLVMLTGQTNFSSVMSHFWPVKILKTFILK